MLTNNKGKKLIAGAVSSALLLGMFPTAVFATEADAAEAVATQSALFFTAEENTTGAALGFENGNDALDIAQIARYDAGMTDADGGVMEIVDYNKVTGWAYAVNGKSGKLTAINLKDIQQGDSVIMLAGNDIDVKALVNADGFTYGDMTSVAVSPDGELLAVAVQAEGYADSGRVVIFQCNNDGTLAFQQAIETGVQPDMVTFTPDGSKILTANEGETRDGHGEGVIDPAGTVTIVSVAEGTAITVGFEEFDHDALAQAGIVLKKGASPAVDLEPEYIAATNDKAYVTLQEANAIAVLDLTSGEFTGIYSAGFEDYSRIAVDIDKKDEAYNPKTYDSLQGIRMPDAISLYQSSGKTYLLTTNEGDSREWGNEDEGTDYLNEDERNFGKKKTSPTGKITADNSGLEGKVVFFDSSDYDGLDENKDYLFGGRSFTMFEVTADGLREIFDSGNDFEAKTAAYLPDYFNCSNDDLTIDDRSGKKGPEPETVVTGTVGDKTYAFITLERIGGIMVYDITEPEQTKFVNYINSRDFSADMAADDSPEGLKFIAAQDSPTGKALLLAACEVGGTVAVYELTDLHSSSGDSDSSGSGSENAGTSGSSSSSSSGGSSSNSIGSSVTVTSPDSNVIVSTTVVSSSVLSDVKHAVEEDTSVTLIGSAVKVSAKENGSTLNSFSNPLTVKMPVSSSMLNLVQDTGRLTLAQVVTGTDGKTELIYMGGNYDANSKNFTAYVDEPGNYVLVEDANVQKVELKVGSRQSMVNGKTNIGDAAPMILDGRTMVPIRFISETLGAQVDWNNATHTVTIQLDGVTMAMTIGKMIEGFDAAPVIQNGRTLVPIRYVAEKLDANVIWVPATQQIIIVR